MKSKKSQKSAKKSQKTNLSSWVDPVYSSTVFILAINDNLDGVLLEVGPSLHLGVLTLNEDERI